MVIVDGKSKCRQKTSSIIFLWVHWFRIIYGHTRSGPRRGRAQLESSLRWGSLQWIYLPCTDYVSMQAVWMKFKHNSTTVTQQQLKGRIQSKRNDCITVLMYKWTMYSYKLYILYFSIPVYTTGSHYSRSTSHSTVLRGSCLLYYRTWHCVCHFRSGLSATAIKEYCIVLKWTEVNLNLSFVQLHL